MEIPEIIEKDTMEESMTMGNSSVLRNPGYNYTKLGWIPEEWKLSKFEDISSIQGGYAFKSALFKEVGEFQIVKMSNVYNGSLDLSRSKSFLSHVDDAEKLYVINNGDILLSLTGTVGKKDYGHTVLITEDNKLLLNQRLGRLTVFDDVSNNYVYFFTKTERFYYQFFLSSKGGTGNQANVSTRDLGKIQIPLPPLPEQQKIAQILSTWDKAIDITEQLISKKQERKKGLMQQLLTGKKRFKEFVKSDKMKETKLGLIPEDWEVRFLGELGNFKNGINKAKEDFGHGVPFVNLMDIFGKIVVKELELDLVNANSIEIENYNLKKGDIIFVRSSVKPSGVGLTSIVDQDLSNTVYSGFLIRFRENYPILEHNFKKYCFYSNPFRNNLIKKSSVSANANINQESLQKLVIAFPSMREQQKIASILSSADLEIEKLQKQLTQFKQQKNGLMHKLLTGEVRVKTDGL